MTEPIFDPSYWKKRLQDAPDTNPHHAIMICDIDRWKKAEEIHRKILKSHINPNDNILDVGCAWGRLLHLMPTTWRGDYLGIDLSPEFIAKAKDEHPDCDFAVRNVLEIEKELKAQSTQLGIARPRFDWAICVSIRDMVITNLGEAAWNYMLVEIKKVAEQVLILEYTEIDKGEIL